MDTLRQKQNYEALQYDADINKRVFENVKKQVAGEKGKFDLTPIQQADYIDVAKVGELIDSMNNVLLQMNDRNNTSTFSGETHFIDAGRLILFFNSIVRIHNNPKNSDNTKKSIVNKVQSVLRPLGSFMMSCYDVMDALLAKNDKSDDHDLIQILTDLSIANVIYDKINTGNMTPITHDEISDKFFKLINAHYEGDYKKRIMDEVAQNSLSIKSYPDNVQKKFEEIIRDREYELGRPLSPIEKEKIMLLITGKRLYDPFLNSNIIMDLLDDSDNITQQYIDSIVPSSGVSEAPETVNMSDAPETINLSDMTEEAEPFDEEQPEDEPPQEDQVEPQPPQPMEDMHDNTATIRFPPDEPQPRQPRPAQQPPTQPTEDTDDPSEKYMTAWNLIMEDNSKYKNIRDDIKKKLNDFFKNNKKMFKAYPKLRIARLIDEYERGQMETPPETQKSEKTQQQQPKPEKPISIKKQHETYYIKAWKSILRDKSKFNNNDYTSKKNLANFFENNKKLFKPADRKEISDMIANMTFDPFEPYEVIPPPQNEPDEPEQIDITTDPRFEQSGIRNEQMHRAVLKIALDSKIYEGLDDAQKDKIKKYYRSNRTLFKGDEQKKLNKIFGVRGSGRKKAPEQLLLKVENPTAHLNFNPDDNDFNNLQEAYIRKFYF
jgi:hypothetical protein